MKLVLYYTAIILVFGFIFHPGHGFSIKQAILGSISGKSSLDTGKNDNVTNGTDVDVKCYLKQTMAWNECSKKVECSFDCMTGEDCTFPYCNMLGECECRPSFCISATMCQFFRIQCNGTFSCQHGNCICG